MVELSPAPRRAGRMELLDCLRFVAATSVVAYHWLSAGVSTSVVSSMSPTPLAGAASYGYLGVYLFFLISGFVIATSVIGRSMDDYLVRRLVRIYPLFWVGLAITTIGTVLFGAPTFDVTVPQVLANVTMVPAILGQPMVDASYWTLFHEILFYLAIAVVVFVGASRHLDRAFPVWGLLLGVASLVLPQYWSTPFIGALWAFFAGGATISVVQRNGWSPLRMIGLLGSFVAGMVFAIRITETTNAAGVRDVEHEPIVTMAIIALCYALLLVQILPSVQQWRIPGSRTLGALTYPMYLLQGHLGYIAINHFASDDNAWWYLPLQFLVLLVLSYALHVVVERWLHGFWLSAFDITVGRAVRWAKRGYDRLTVHAFRRVGAPGGTAGGGDARPVAPSGPSKHSA